MKKSILLFLLLNVFLNFEAQIYYSTGPTVYTCRGGQIATLIPNRELTTTEKASAVAIESCR